MLVVVGGGSEAPFSYFESKSWYKDLVKEKKIVSAHCHPKRNGKRHEAAVAYHRGQRHATRSAGDGGEKHSLPLSFA